MAQEKMTPAQADFVARYAKETEGFQIHAVGEGEGGFSWSPCDTCGCTLGGDRFDCVLTNPGPGQDKIEVRSCVDCVQYAANGTLPEGD